MESTTPISANSAGNRSAFLTLLYCSAIALAGCSNTAPRNETLKELAFEVLGAGDTSDMPARVRAAERLAQAEDAAPWLILLLQTRTAWKSQNPGFNDDIKRTLEDGERGLITVLLTNIPQRADPSVLLAVVDLLSNQATGHYSRKSGPREERLAEVTTGPISDHAETALRRCTGKDLGKDVQKWRAYLLGED